MKNSKLNKSNNIKNSINVSDVSNTSPKFKIINKDDRSLAIVENVKRLKVMLVDDKQVDVYLPNEIFDDLLLSPLFKNWQQQAFAYTWYYVISYLFRNCSYAKVANVTALNLSNIRKNILGVKGETLVPVYKKNGVLDQLGYTASLSDFPIKPIYELGVLDSFLMFREQMRDLGVSHTESVPPHFLIKVPLKGLYKHPPKDYLVKLLDRKTNSEIDEQLRYYDGHFFDLYNTHRIHIKCLIACLANSILGYKGFYLYGFYRMQSDRFKGGYSATVDQLRTILPIEKKTLEKYHSELARMKLIEIVSVRGKPNKYKASNNIAVIEI